MHSHQSLKGLVRDTTQCLNFSPLGFILTVSTMQYLEDYVLWKTGLYYRIRDTKAFISKESLGLRFKKVTCSGHGQTPQHYCASRRILKPNFPTQ